MANESKKHDTGSDKITVGPSPEERAALALESLDLTMGEILLHVATVAKALDALAKKLAPDPVRSFSSPMGLPVCAEGHRMQPTDAYCQVCNPGTPKPPRAPRAA